LPMLATHLSFPQIAKQMSLSRHTVKAEVTSIYRKLGAASRDQAVARARDLGLLDQLQEGFGGFFRAPGHHLREIDTLRNAERARSEPLHLRLAPEMNTWSRVNVGTGWP